MENNNNNNIPTVSEIMKEISAISSDSAQVPSVDSIQAPNVTDIPSMPTIAEAVAAQTAPAASAPTESVPAQTAPVQTAPVQTAPVQTAPVQTAPVQASPVQAIPYYVPAQAEKKTNVARILCVIAGSILSLIGLVFVIALIGVWGEQPPTSTDELVGMIFASVIMLIPLFIGVPLLFLGGKKKENLQPVVTGQYTYPTTTAAGQSPYYPANAADTSSYPYAANAADTSSYPYAANAAGTPVPTASPAPTVTNAGTTVPTQTPSVNPAPVGYQYAAGTPIIPDGGEKYNKSKAFWSGLGSIACVIGFWLIAFLLDRGSLWLLILPFALSFDAIRRKKGKSFLGWLGMILSVLSAALFIYVMYVGITSQLS